MSRHSNGWPQQRTGLYTANDYIKDLLADNENNKYYIKQLEGNNKQWIQKNEDLNHKIKDLLLKDQQKEETEKSLRESIAGLKSYIKKLELKIGAQKTTEDNMTLCATESTAKYEVKPSRVMVHNTVSDQTFAVKCGEHQTDHYFINMTELKANTQLPKKFAALLIEWRLLPMTVIDGQNARLLDVSKWDTKTNTIVNLISLDCYPFRPNSGQVFKIDFNSIIDLKSLERQSISPSMASKTSQELDLQMKELQKYLQFIKDCTEDNDDNTVIDSSTDSKEADITTLQKNPSHKQTAIPICDRFQLLSQEYGGLKIYENVKASNLMLGWKPGRGRAKSSPLEDFDNLEHKS